MKKNKCQEVCGLALFVKQITVRGGSIKTRRIVDDNWMTMENTDIHFMQITKIFTNKLRKPFIQFQIADLTCPRHDVEIIIIYGNFGNRAKIWAETRIFIVPKELKLALAIAPKRTNVLVNFDTIVRTKDNVSRGAISDRQSLPRLFRIDNTNCLTKNKITVGNVVIVIIAQIGQFLFKQGREFFRALEVRGLLLRITAFRSLMVRL